MSLTTVDRWLLVCIMIFVGVLVCQTSLPAACDNKCRMWQTFILDSGTSIGCAQYWLPDCLFCSGFATGLCSDTVNPGAGTCTAHAETQQYSRNMTSCSLVCALNPKGSAQANPGMSTTTWFAGGDVYDCE